MDLNKIVELEDEVTKDIVLDNPNKPELWHKAHKLLDDVEEENWLEHAERFTFDPVERPKHYANRRYEVIDVIEDNVSRSPDAVVGALQWQVLKYICRMWDKESPRTDARKARWYLDRLIENLDA